MLFSNRTQWNLSQNYIATAISQLKESKHEIFDLTQSNPTRCDFLFPQEAVLKAFLNKNNLAYDPQSQGMLSAREAICHYYALKKIKVDPENILLTASTSEGYSLLFKLLANPQDAVLFPQPSYPLFQFLCDINDIQIQYYPLMYNQKWQIAMERLSDTPSEAKAFVIVNPNNPTGSILSLSELKGINQFCKRKDMAIICDEVFSDYLFKNTRDYISLAGNREVLTFTLGGLSKTLAMPQMKLSWILFNGPDDLVKQAKERLEVIADTYLSVNTPVQNALRILLSCSEGIQSQINERIDRNLQRLKERLKGFTAASYLNAEGGWYCVLKIPSLYNEEQFILDLIEKDHVLVHPGYFYDFQEDGHIVLSLIVKNQVFSEGVNKVLERVKTL